MGAKSPTFAHSHQAAFSSLFRAMGQLHVTPQDVLRMEAWQAASMLGVGYDDGEDPDAPAQTTTPTGNAPQQSVTKGDMDILKARLAHAAGQGPKPEAGVTSADAFRSMIAGAKPQ